jgi:CRISPR-associated exonuclease Cas4
MTTEFNTNEPTGQSTLQRLREKLTAEQFHDWYRERQYRKNIEDGTPYFNGAGTIPDLDRHSPSQLLQCHRKILYRQSNTPAEQPAPDGIFWFGTRFEEDIAFPFLERAVTGPDTYVRNTEWIDITVDTAAGNLQLKGITDPVIVDADAVPVLPTEIKTKKSVDTLKAPSDHHKAQLHAYMAGLSEKYEINVTDGVILYGSRNTLDVCVFHIEFDKEFWQDTVVAWAGEHTQYRLDDELPPATPEVDWECKFCDYRERCGKASTPYNDTGTTGLLPLYSDYPKENVCEYLDAHPDACLTPTLAHVYPALAEKYDVANWVCKSCDSTIRWDKIEQTPTPSEPPVCPNCADNGTLTTLQGPAPRTQNNQCKG